MGASIRPSMLVPMRKPTKLERKHPKVTPHSPTTGEKRGSRVRASLSRSWIIPAEVPKAKGPLTRVRTVYNAPIREICTRIFVLFFAFMIAPFLRATKYFSRVSGAGCRRRARGNGGPFIWYAPYCSTAWGQLQELPGVLP